MLSREAEFSTYRDIKVHILSWNIDSCKPTDLQGDAVNIDFLQNAILASVNPVVTNEEPPEILVFGFQEVVDLEDKKLTASKRQEASEICHLLISSDRIHAAWQKEVRSYVPGSGFTSIHEMA
jgi:hypothetical protein